MTMEDMNKEYEEIKSVLSSLDSDGTLKVGHCKEELAEQIEQLAIPNQPKELFSTHWPRTVDALVGPYRIRTAGQILAPHDLNLLLPVQLIAIGNSLVGDFLTMRTTDDSTEVGLINGALLWDETIPPLSKYVSFAPSLLEFLLVIRRGDAIPVDFYDAGGDD